MAKLGYLSGISLHSWELCGLHGVNLSQERKERVSFHKLGENMILKTLRMAENMITEIECKANKENRSFSAMVRILIQKGLESK